MTNGLLSHILLKRVRLIRIFSQERVLETLRSYLTWQTFRDKLHSLIIDPYQQLKLELPILNGFQDTVTCSELETSAHLLRDSLMSCVKKVRSLRLKVPGLFPFLLKDSDLLFIVSWINDNPSLCLRGFSLINYNFTDLPIVHNLESLAIERAPNLLIDGLHISAYPNLHKLSISWCKSVEDVSCLDGIHDLLLQGCEGIRDISCLNHNYKIAIQSCNNIVDYSHCFRYSKVVRIQGPMNIDARELELDLSTLLEVREIDIKMIRSETPIKSFVLPYCGTLRRVLIQSIKPAFSLPPSNHIRELSITSCAGFESLVNAGSISFVKLVSLTISTLEGLGDRNRHVQICRCPNIKDFSLLRHCNKIMILNCQGFHDFDQVRGVKDFTFSPFDAQNIPEDMEGVTCLQLDNLELFKFPSSLKELKLQLRDMSMLEQIPSFLSSLPDYVKKIQVFNGFRESIDKFRSMMENGDVFLPQFTIEFIKMQLRAISFLRKSD